MRRITSLHGSAHFTIPLSTTQCVCQKIAKGIFRKSKLHIDEESYKKVKYQVQNLIR